MQIPILIFLYLYLMMVTIFIIFSIFLLYHAFRFGTSTLTNLIIMLIYLAGASIFLIGSYAYLNQVDWSQAIILF